MPKILLVEDDTHVADAVIDSLETQNHTVEWTKDGKEGLNRLRLYDYDMAILDWNLPSLTGIEICKQYRESGGSLPILLLTGKSEVSEKVDGFDAGADDYLTKPFSMKELIVRVRALLRRPPETLSNNLQFQDVSLDLKACTATRAGRTLGLLPKEFAVLEFFLRHRNQVFSVQDLLNRLWSSESDSSEDAVRQVITRLRKKLDAPGEDSLIITVKGLGYKVED